MSELEKLCREAYGAYEYLRDHDLAAQSGTSKRLRSGDPNKLRSRLAEELGELKGVIEGTHFHEGFDQDIILEGYEVWYWAASLMSAQHFAYAEIQPHLSFESGFKLPASERDAALKLIPDTIAAVQIEPADKAATLALFGKVIQTIGMACSLNNTPPLRLLERDTTEMRQKAYLSDYWGKG